MMVEGTGLSEGPCDGETSCEITAWDGSDHVLLSVPTGCPQSPMSKATLTLITVCTCVVAVVYGTQTSCPLTVKVTLHVPEHFIADGEQSMGASHETSRECHELYFKTIRNPSVFLLHYSRFTSAKHKSIASLQKTARFIWIYFTNVFYEASKFCVKRLSVPFHF